MGQRLEAQDSLAARAAGIQVYRWFAADHLESSFCVEMHITYGR